MGVNELRTVISQYRLLALDTLVFFYHLSDHPLYAPLTSVVLEAIEVGEVQAFTTALTLADILTVPTQAGNQHMRDDYEFYLTHFPNLQLVSVDAAIARETAVVRASCQLRTRDAVEVAAARLMGANAIVTNNSRWADRVKEPAAVLLDDYVGDD